MYTTEQDKKRNTGGKIETNSRSTQLTIGAFIVVFGFFMLLRRMGVQVPHWLFGWEMILIAVGVVMGIKSRFRDLTWIIPVIIGTIFISDDIIDGFRYRNLIWPLGIITIGLFILARGSRHRADVWDDMPVVNTPPAPVVTAESTPVTGFRRMDEPGGADIAAAPSAMPNEAQPMHGPDDELDCVAIFGGVKRTVVSKQFKGGEIVAVFGGAEIDLTYADINGIVKLEATNILGGTKLIVPPTWDIQSEMVAIFGGVEDKRRIQPELINRNKRLVLMGTAFLGGLEIKSF